MDSGGSSRSQTSPPHGCHCSLSPTTSCDSSLPPTESPTIGTSNPATPCTLATAPCRIAASCATVCTLTMVLCRICRHMCPHSGAHRIRRCVHPRRGALPDPPPYAPSPRRPAESAALCAFAEGSKSRIGPMGTGIAGYGWRNGDVGYAGYTVCYVDHHLSRFKREVSPQESTYCLLWGRI